MPDPITAVVYSESGGTYKTTNVANIAVALSRMDLNVLCIDLDPQEGNLTSLFDLGEHRDDPDADNIVRHLLEQPAGDFEDLIETSSEGVDVIPSHSMLSDFTRHLQNKKNAEVGLKYDDDDAFPRYEFLYRLLWDTQELYKEYDAVLIDPNARAEDLLYNAIYALRTLVAPVKPGGKGNLSLDGLHDLLENLEADLEIEVGVAAVVPNAITQNNAHQQYTRQFREDDSLETPVEIGDRESMMDDMWEANASAFRVIEHRWKTYGDRDTDEVPAEPGVRRVRDREIETLQKIYALGYFLASDIFDHDVSPDLTVDVKEYADGEPVGTKTQHTFDVRELLHQEVAKQ